MSFANPFAPKPRGVLGDVVRVKALVRDVLGLPEAVGVTVSEIVCRDPVCPGLETVILIMPPGAPTRHIRIPGPIAAVTKDALAAAGAVPESP